MTCHICRTYFSVGRFCIGAAFLWPLVDWTTRSNRRAVFWATGNLAVCLVVHFARYNESQLRDDMNDDAGDGNADAGTRTIDFGRFSMEKWNLLDTLNKTRRNGLYAWNSSVNSRSTYNGIVTSDPFECGARLSTNAVTHSEHTLLLSQRCKLRQRLKQTHKRNDQCATKQHTYVYIWHVDVSMMNRGPLVGRMTVPGTRFSTSLNGANFFS